MVSRGAITLWKAATWLLTLHGDKRGKVEVKRSFGYFASAAVFVAARP